MPDGQRPSESNLIDDIFAHNFSRKVHPAEDLSDPLPEFPITFHDRHVDAGLSLLRVKILPSLPQLLSTLCDKELERFKPETRSAYDLGEDLNPPRKEQLDNAQQVASYYGDNLGIFCMCVASAACLHPDENKLESVTEFKLWPTSPTKRSTFTVEAGIALTWKYRAPFNPNLGYLVDEATLLKLNKLADYSSDLAIWNFYPITTSGAKILTKMADCTNFDWKTSDTRHFELQASCTANQPDADTDFVTNVLLKPSARRPGKPKKKAGKSTAHPGSSSAVVPAIPRRNANSDKPYRVEWQDFIQHAWARAVAEDATFIILNCGKYERIGVRHRASRTLYLSECISTTTCRSPSYGKLHLGLHFAILNDALRRLDLREFVGGPGHRNMSLQQDNMAPGGRKRSRDLEDESPPKGGKVHRTEVSENHSTFACHAALSTRDLFLVNLDYNVLHSPTPSSFMRKGPSCAPGFYQPSEDFVSPSKRKSYQSHEYVTITLSTPIYSGATGTAHRGKASICLPSGEVLVYNVVMKLVFPDRDTRPKEERTYTLDPTGHERVLREYPIYQHLASAGCHDGILPVFGLFEDIESGTLALIMDDGGTSLLEIQNKERKAVNEILSQHNREHLVEIIHKIHKAGVRHRDIGPQNMLLSDENKVFVIDFDMAECLSSSIAAQKMSREALFMEHTVNGTVDWKNHYYSH